MTILLALYWQHVQERLVTIAKNRSTTTCHIIVHCLCCTVCMREMSRLSYIISKWDPTYAFAAAHPRKRDNDIALTLRKVLSFDNYLFISPQLTPSNPKTQIPQILKQYPTIIQSFARASPFV